MKTLSVRDLRQRWPQAEALLRVEHEIIISRWPRDDADHDVTRRGMRRTRSIEGRYMLL